jgi:hypothetical protein
MANIPWLMAVLGRDTTSLTNGTLAIYYNPPMVHWPYTTIPQWYIGHILQSPNGTLAIYYNPPMVHWPYTTIPQGALLLL